MSPFISSPSILNQSSKSLSPSLSNKIESTSVKKIRSNPCTHFSVDPAKLKRLRKHIQHGLTRLINHPQQNKVGEWWRSIRKGSNSEVALHKLTKELHKFDEVLHTCLRSFNQASSSCKAICTYSMDPVVYIKLRIHFAHIEQWIDDLIIQHQTLRSSLSLENPF